MNNVVITADSAIDLTPEQASFYDVHIIPMHIILNDTDYLDGVSIQSDYIYSFYKTNKILPNTSAISVAEYEDFFKSFTSDGKSVIHISLSSSISSTHHNAVIASKSFDNVYILDSKRLSCSLALLAIKARELIVDGLDADEILKRLLQERDKVQTFFLLDTLEYMKKGGRCSAITAFGANILGIKPSIRNTEDGTLLVDKKYRGKLSLIRKQFVDDIIVGDNIDYSRIIVAHSGMPQDEFDDVTEHIRKTYPFKDIILCRAGCTISTHCGPGAVGVQFMYL